MTSAAQEQITVRRNGKDFLVRSTFSQTHDVVIRMHFGFAGMPNEQAYLIPKSTPLSDYPQHDLMHNGGDENPAYIMPMYGALGGNHGSAYGRLIEIPDHGLTTKDLGARLTTENKGDFYILQVKDKDNIVIHPENLGQPGGPKFAVFKDDKLFRDGEEIKYTAAQVWQLLPSNRVRENSYLVNGTDPLPDMTEVQCDFFDHVFDYEVVMPDYRVELFKNKPGVAHDFLAPEIPAMLDIRTTARYQARGACVVAVKSTVLHDMPGYDCLGVMMGWAGGLAEKQQTEFYIPKLKPLTATGHGGHPDLDCDFSAIYVMPDKMPVNYIITKNDCIDPENPPDRFIRLVGDGKREIGVALGYSLFEGVTAKHNKAKDRKKIYFLWHTKKMYPYAINIINCHAGDTRELMAYRQYFDPQREPDATAFYFHRQADSDVVYLDFHQALDRKNIALPAHMAGKRISILEKTPSVSLHTEDLVSQNGISLSVAGNYGYIVLKLD